MPPNQEVSAHGRVLEPISRASMWRKGFKNPKDYDDDAGYCGGFQVMTVHEAMKSLNSRSKSFLIVKFKKTRYSNFAIKW